MSGFFLLLFQIFLWVLIALIIIGACYFLYNLMAPLHGKAPYVSSFDRQLVFLKKKIAVKKGSKVVDLGCGDGKALRFFVKNYDVTGVGYDLNRRALFWGKLMNRYYRYKKSIISYRYSDITLADLSNADIVYCYLWPAQNKKISDWLFSSIKQDCVVVSNSFAFDKKATTILKSDHARPVTFYIYTKQGLSELPKIGCVQVKS